MKYILLFLLFNQNSQTVFYNMPTNQIYIVDIDQNPIQILIIEENIEIEISCINNQKKNIKDVNFTTANTCLQNSLNKAFDLNIQEFVDFKDNVTKEQFKNLKENKNLKDALSLLTSISHSYSLPDIFNTYSKLNKNEFKYQTHSFIYLVIDDEYIPLSLS